MKKVVIDCEQNDYDDIMYGGPLYLGFTFYVDDSEDDEDLKKFLRETLKKNNRDCLGINIYKMPDKVWNRTEMENYIKTAKLHGTD